MLDLELPNNIRCYNGCYDSDTQRVLDAQEAVLREIRTVEPEAHVAYFPSEGQYVVHVWGRELSKYASSRGAAIADAHNRIFRRS